MSLLSNGPTQTLLADWLCAQLVSDVLAFCAPRFFVLTADGDVVSLGGAQHRKRIPAMATFDFRKCTHFDVMRTTNRDQNGVTFCPILRMDKQSYAYLDEERWVCTDQHPAVNREISPPLRSIRGKDGCALVYHRSHGYIFGGRGRRVLRWDSDDEDDGPCQRCALRPRGCSSEIDCLRGRTEVERKERINGRWSWSKVSDLPEARVFATAIAAADSDYIYVCGGWPSAVDEGYGSTTVFQYAITSNTWLRCTSQLRHERGRFTAGAAVGDGRILIIGGGYNEGELFDPLTGTWVVCKDEDWPKLALAVISV